MNDLTGDPQKNVALVIVASGRGLRMGREIPKQFLSLGGKAVLIHSLEVGLSHPRIGTVILVVHPDHQSHLDLALKALPDGKATANLTIVHGGETRQESVNNGLEALAKLPDKPDLVLVHDAARPFLSPALVSCAISAAAISGAAIPSLPLFDTIKQIDSSGMVIDTLPREALRRIQTPQAFGFDMLLAAHRTAKLEGRFDFTDDASLVEWQGESVHVFDGDEATFKITTDADMIRAERHLLRLDTKITKVATGYDVHAFGAGDHIWLSGLRIPHNRGLIGHSDADPVLHALTDAVLGTISDGDIGSHFPPNDEKWKGAASHIFLRHAVDLLLAKGGQISHLDATIICEEPKIGPYRVAMREQIASICSIDVEEISVKATTTERLGFTGRKEGIAAIGTATVLLPQRKKGI